MLLGCGWTQYQDEPGSSVSIVVCNYVEQGNVEGEAVYEVGEAACTNCGVDYTCSEDGVLCRKI